MTLSGSNTYSGTTTISAGNLLLEKINALPTNTTLSVSLGAVLNLQGYNAQVGSLAGAGDVQLGSGIFTAGGNGTTTTFSGITSGTGGLTKTGAGTLTLSGSNSYTGATLVSAGTLALGKTDALSSLSPVTVNSTFNLGTFSQTLGSLAGSGSVVMGGGTLRVGAANSPTTFSGVISGTGSLVKLGSGVLTLTGSSTTTAALDLNAGTIILSGAGGSLASTSSVIVRSGSTLELNNSVTENANRLSNSSAIQMDGGTLRLISDADGTT